MKPAARVQAAIEVLDQILAGTPVEQALTGWARRNRYAGSKDRAAVRDHVFDATRCRRSFAALGGAMTGRGLMLGAVRQAGTDPDEVFNDVGYAPAPLTDEERMEQAQPAEDAERLDIPDWVWPKLKASHADQTTSVAQALQSRAPVHLRVNLRKTTREDVQQSLTRDGIICVSHPASLSALEVTEGNRRIRQNAAYQDGLVELQDAASQALVDALPLEDGQKVLDFCAGGGGKSLAIAARADVQVFAHDAMPHRMRDLPERARRAGVTIPEIAPQDVMTAGPFDVVLCDVPCSGSGAWRRAPDGKWRLTPEDLETLKATQFEILQQAAALVAPDGVLAYATCSLLDEENADQIDRFLAKNPGWARGFQKVWDLQGGTDGFFTAHLTRVKI